MGSFNKVLSFVLGLVVVVVFLIVLGTRIDVTKSLLSLRDNNTTQKTKTTISAVPTPSKTIEQKGFFATLFGGKSTVTPTTTPQTMRVQQTTPNQTTQQNAVQTQPETTQSTATTIPKTGAPTFLISTLLSALGAGMYLRRRS